ncbi:hypothetical protein [Mesorhizobium sp. NPDC059025]|uniref:hypothetical protein n=1 Tax=unclassified Mesorhizobium TaxID=325217 RepID=UPI00366E24C9
MTILFAFGMPGVMSAWGFAALQAVAREALGEYAAITSDRVEDLEEHLKYLPKPHAVVISQFPEARLSVLMKQAKLPLVLFQEDPLDAVSYLARCTGEQDLKLVRAVSASLACLALMEGHPKVLNIHRGKASERPGIDTLLEDINRHFHIDLKPDAIARCLPHLGMEPPRSGRYAVAVPHFEDAASSTITGYVPPQEAGKVLSEELRRIALKVFWSKSVVAESSTSTISWPQEVFFHGDKPGEGLTDIINLAGGARCLVYGPYLHLPAGCWHAQITFAIEEDAFGQTFTIEIHASAMLGKLRVRPIGTGFFVATIPFVVTEPKTPIEIRLLMDSGAIEGSLSSWAVDMLMA